MDMMQQVEKRSFLFVGTVLIALLVGGCSGTGIGPAGSVTPPVTPPATIVRASVSTSGAQGDNASTLAALSGDGRFVVFASLSSSLVAGDTNGVRDIFLRDTCFGAAGCTPSTTRISVATDGTQADGESSFSAISADGRFVAFVSLATNLVANDTNGVADIFLRDTCFGAVGCTPSTTRVSVSSTGIEGSSASTLPAISGSGRFIAFESASNNLVTSDTNGVTDIFLRDTCFGAAGCTPSTTRVSVATNGSEGSAVSGGASLSSDGRFVAFHSFANNLVTGDNNGAFDVFLRDTCFGVAGCTPSTTRVSVSTAGAEGSSGSVLQLPSISGDGRFIAFESLSDNLVSGDTNGVNDIFLRDTCFGAAVCTPSTTRVSVSTAGAEGSSASSFAVISANSRFVAFHSISNNLVSGDTNGLIDIFVRDTCFGAAGCTPSTIRVSVSATGAEADADSFRANLSDAGGFVSFHSSASTLVSNDTNGVSDVFRAATGF